MWNDKVKYGVTACLNRIGRVLMTRTKLW